MEERKCVFIVPNYHMFRIATSEVLDENDPINWNWQPVQDICHWKLYFIVSHTSAKLQNYYQIKQR